MLHCVFQGTSFQVMGHQRDLHSTQNLEGNKIIKQAGSLLIMIAYNKLATFFFKEMLREVKMVDQEDAELVSPQKCIKNTL